MTPAPRGARRSGAVLVAVAAMGWGTWPFFLRRAEATGSIAPAIEAVASMLALGLASGVLVRRDRLRVRAQPVHWALIATLGVSDALNVVFFFAAYQRTSVAIAVLTHYLTPTLVAVGAPLVVHEPWRARTFFAVAVSSVGLALLLEPWSASRHAGDLVGAAFGAASAVCYTLNVLISKRLVPVFAGSEMSFFHALVALPLLALLVPGGAWGALHVGAVFWLALGALFPGALCGLLFVWGLRRVPASQASNLTLFEPLVATLAASIAFHEHLGPLAWVGGALILLGAAVSVGRDAPPAAGETQAAPKVASKPASAYTSGSP